MMAVFRWLKRLILPAKKKPARYFGPHGPASTWPDPFEQRRRIERARRGR